jgi:glycosyltransferase involved in cell wall biosynthesis
MASLRSPDAGTRCTIVMPLAERQGGAESSLMELVDNGGGLGFAWRVVFLEEGPMVAACEGAGVPAAVIPAGRLREVHRYARCVARLAASFRRDRPGVVVGWMTKAHLYSGPAARAACVPAVWCQHGMPSSGGAVDRLATALPARGVIAVSDAVRSAQLALRPRRRVEVARPGVDLERFDPNRLPPPAEARARLGLPAEGPIVGVVARLQRWKGVHVLAESLPDVVRAHPDLHCVVVGGAHELEPEYEGWLKRKAGELGLGERMTFAGAQSDVAPWMQAMDVLVNASAEEPFGLTLVEAMALGKPVVAAAGGGALEIVRDRVDGLLVPHGDQVALASALRLLLDDRRLAADLGRAGRERAREFSSRRWAERFTACVRELVR